MEPSDRDDKWREAQEQTGGDREKTPPVSGRPVADPAADVKRSTGAQGSGESNEGEGSRSADRRYREGVQKTVRSGDPEREAERARRDVEANPDEYRRAEEAGKERSSGDAPGDLER